MLILLALIVVLLLFGGIGYGYRDSWGGYYPGGLGLIGLLLLVVLFLWLIGALT